MCRRVVILGLDGASWSIIDRLLETNKLPNFKRLLDNGSRAVLLPTIPPLTPPSWTSIATGVHPGKHGIFDFYKRRSYRKLIVDATDITADALWAYCSKHDLKVCAVNFPVSYPPGEVKGYIVSGEFSPKGTYAFPGELKADLAKRGYQSTYQLLNPQDKQGILQNIVQTFENRRKVLTEVLSGQDWDLQFIVIQATDRIQHFFYDTIGKEDDLVAGIYVMVDEVLGKMQTSIDRDTTLMVVSDHGIAPLTKFVNLNVLLMREGLLTTRSGVSAFLSRHGLNSLDVYRRLPAFLTKLVFDIKLDWLKTAMPDKDHIDIA